MLPPRESLRTAVAELLSRRIVRGELVAGAALNLAELAASTGVSATPMREALVELERDGLVQSILNRGFVVRPLDTEEMRELYPVVAAMEVLALESGPPSPARLTELQAINARLRKEKQPGKRIDLDDRWHATLLADCPNATLLRLLETLKRRLYRYEYAFMSAESASPDSVRQHDEIVKLLTAGRRKQAAKVLAENWLQAIERSPDEMAADPDADADGPRRKRGAERRQPGR
jgi:DNA-binding GntR family transcriptional regulator